MKLISTTNWLSAEYEGLLLSTWRQLLTTSTSADLAEAVSLLVAALPQGLVYPGNFQGSQLDRNTRQALVQRIVDTKLIGNGIEEFDLRAAGLIDNDDFSYWFSMLGAASKDAPVDPESPLYQLALACAAATTAQRTIAEGVVRSNEHLSEIVEEWFSDRRIQLQQANDERQRATEISNARSLQGRRYSRDRASQFVEVSDWVSLESEIAKPGDLPSENVTVRVTSPRTLDRLNADGLLPGAAGAARHYLETPLHDFTPRALSAAAAAIELLVVRTPETWTSVSPAAAAQWLAPLLDQSTTPTVSHLFDLVASATPNELNSMLVERIASDAVGLAHAAMIHRLGAFQSDPVTAALIEVLADSRTHVEKLHSIATALLSRDPDAGLAEIWRAVEHRGQEPDGDTSDMHCRSSRPLTAAVAMTAALIESPAINAALEQLLSIFNEDHDFAEQVLQSIGGTPFGGASFRHLDPERHAEVYLWAALAQPDGDAEESGIAQTANVQLNRILRDPTTAAVESLGKVANSLAANNQPELSRRIRRLQSEATQSIRQAMWTPPHPESIAVVLDTLRTTV